MAKNSNLNKAKKTQNDEFYTRYEDIEKELNHYEKHFKNKTVLMNCDDPTWSNFWKYFHLNFEYLGLKKIISTHYEYQQVPSYKMEYEGGNDENYEVGIKTILTQNGDFRSPECVKLLKESDIVCTNPPFSIAREYYIPQLFDYHKKFLIVGDLNWVKYKDVFPLLKDTKMWLGYNWIKEFIQPNGTMKKFGNKLWFTNLDHLKRHEWIDTPYLFSKKDELYPNLYTKYDNYDAINVDKVSEIPMDYEGIMGVPITFMDKHNAEQFEIVGEFNHGSDNEWDLAKPIVNGKELYPRIAIRKKQI